MSGNEYRIVITLPKADGFHQRTDRDRARNVERAIRVGLADCHEVIDDLTIEKVPPPHDCKGG